jgi:beta-1,2-mannobiose phosphorylase / 1,2-beta-oligomannan phosphorylase
MIRRLSTNLMIRPEDMPPSREDWEVIGTFNPGAVRLGNDVVLLVRVAERPREKRGGFIALPRWAPDEGLVIDWATHDEVDFMDPRVVRRKVDGTVRLTFVSSIRVAYSRDGKTIDRIGEPVLAPQETYEEFGVEDPRITPLDGRYYITYVAVSQHGAATALASTTDFKSFERHGIIFCPENKDVVLFPEQIRDQYVALHRPNGATRFSSPQMWIASSPDLIHWGKHRYLYGGQRAWETGRIGGGTPPIAVKEGWLEIYHGNLRPTVPGEVGAYFGAVMLLDKDEPARVLGIGREPVLTPTTDFEREGFVANVVFPTAVVEAGERLLVYYGASDKYSAVVELDRAEVMQILE